MFNTALGVIRNGRVELTEAIDLIEGSRVLVTVLQPDDDAQFWLAASQPTLRAIWDNPEDDRYAELLEK